MAGPSPPSRARAILENLQDFYDRLPAAVESYYVAKAAGALAPAVLGSKRSRWRRGDKSARELPAATAGAAAAVVVASPGPTAGGVDAEMLSSGEEDLEAAAAAARKASTDDRMGASPGSLLTAAVAAPAADGDGAATSSDEWASASSGDIGADQEEEGAAYKRPRVTQSLPGHTALRYSADVGRPALAARRSSLFLGPDPQSLRTYQETDEYFGALPGPPSDGEAQQALASDPELAALLEMQRQNRA